MSGGRREGGFPRMFTATTSRVLALGMTILFALLFFQQSTQLYVIDEAEFPLVGKAIAELGRPQYYRGEDLPMNLGVWHPPGYPYALGLWEQVFGSSHTAVRSFGLSCTFFAAGLGWLILRRLFPRSMPWLGVAWLAAYLLHPYVLQSALLPDIDSTALVATSALCLWLIVEVLLGGRTPTPLTAVWLGVALGLAFLCKLTTPLALIPPMVISLTVTTRSFRRTGLLSGILLGVAAVVFTATWGALSRIADLPFRYPFSFTLDSLDQKAGGQPLSDRLALLWPSRTVVFWITPGLLILFGLGIVAAVLFARSSQRWALVCLALFAVTVFCTYNIITGPPFGFPKYYAPILLPVTLVAIAPLAHFGRSLELRGWFGHRTPKILALGFFLFLVALSYIQFARNRTTQLHPLRPVWFLIVLSIAVAAGVVSATHPIRGTEPRSPLGLPGAAAVLWIGFAVAVVSTSWAVSLHQRGDTASVRYFPGERDLRETVVQTRRLVVDSPPTGTAVDARLVSAKDVGFESGVRYYEDGFYLGRPAVLASLLRSQPGMIMVTRSAGDFAEPYWPAGFSVLRSLATPVWVSPSGSFTIWRARPGSASG